VVGDVFDMVVEFEWVVVLVLFVFLGLGFKNKVLEVFVGGLFVVINVFGV